MLLRLVLLLLHCPPAADVVIVAVSVAVAVAVVVFVAIVS